MGPIPPIAHTARRPRVARIARIVRASRSARVARVAWGSSGSARVGVLLALGALLVAGALVLALVIAHPASSEEAAVVGTHVERDGQLDAISNLPADAMPLSGVEARRPEEAVALPVRDDEVGPSRANGHRLELALHWDVQAVRTPHVVLTREDSTTGVPVRTGRVRVDAEVVFDELADGDYSVTIDDRAWSHSPVRISLRGEPHVERRDVAIILRDRISGVIRMADGGPPPHDLLLILRAERPGESPVRAVLDAHGTYRLGGWGLSDEVREVRMIADEVGSSPVRSAWLALGDPHDFVLDGVDLVLQPEAWVRGRVVHAASGAPLQASVSLLPAPHDDRRRSDGDGAVLDPTDRTVRTDPDGAYALRTRAPARFVLAVASEEGGWISDTHRIEPGDEQQRDVELAGRTLLFGTVRASSPEDVTSWTMLVGSPAARARTPFAMQEVVLDESGAFRFDDVPAGRLQLALSAADARAGTRVLFAEELVLHSGETRRLEIALARHDVSGHVLLPEGSPARIECYAVSPLRLVATAAPDVAGRFAFTVQQPGQHVVFVRSVYDETLRILSYAPLSIDPAGAPSDEVVLDATRTTLAFASTVDARRTEDITTNRPLTLEPVGGETWMRDALAALTAWTPRDVVWLGLPAGRYRVLRENSGSPYPPIEFELREDEPLRVEVP